MTRERQIALIVLRTAAQDGTSVAEACEGNHRVNPGTFARSLIDTTLAHILEIDGLITRYIEKPLTAELAPVTHVLRLGIAQIRYLNIPAYAAVSTSVDLVTWAGYGGYRGLVNAVLRRIADGQPPKHLEGVAA